MQSTKTRKLKRRFAAAGTAVAAAFMSFAMAFSACAVTTDTGKTVETDNGRPSISAASGAFSSDTNSLRYVVSDPADFEEAWNAAIKTSKDKGKQVWFVLGTDWEAPVGGGNPFGADSDGFSYGRIQIPAGADIVIDLNGHTINRRLSSEVVYGSVICVDGKLTIDDSAGGGRVTGGHTTTSTSPGAPSFSYDFGGGVLVEDGGDFTLENGAITGNYSYACAGVYVVGSGSVFTMNGGEVSYNEAPNGDAGIGVETNATATINGGVISYNKATGANGGGMTVYGGCTVTINGGTITRNEAESGGGILIKANATLIFNGGEISYNTATTGTEGAICMMTACTVELNGGLITQNTQASGSTISPGGASVVKVGGPVKIYDNFTSGAQANLKVHSAKALEITGPIISENGAAYIGISTTLGNNTILSSGLKSNGGFSSFSNDAAVWFFADANSNRRIVLNSAKTEIMLSTAGSTEFFNVDWQYQLNNSGAWVSASNSELNLTYGDKVTAVRTMIDSLTAHEWTEGTTTQSYQAYCDSSGASSTPFSSIENAGKYSFMVYSDDAFWNAYWASKGNVYATIFPATFTVTVQPKDINVKLIDKGSQYGTAIADMYKEEDEKVGGVPTGNKIKAEVDPATPLVGADASYALNTFVNISTEATNTSDLGSYNITGTVKSTAPFDTKNYNFKILPATYSVGAATVTAKLGGSKTYNGLAQNSATVTINYPTGFAGTKMTTTDYTVTYPAGGCVKADTYDNTDISLSLNSTTNAGRFVLDSTNPLTGSYEIKKATLTCTADDKTVGVGDPVPTYTATYTGFVNGETAASVITTAPTFTCTYTTTSPKGNYTITPSGAAADNYDFTYKTGKVIVGTGSVAKPSIALAAGFTGIYGGNEQTFDVTYTSGAMTVTLSDSTNFTWDPTTATIKATKAGKCKVTFTLDTSKYTWTDSTMAPEEIEIEIKPMPLVFSLTATGDTSWKWDYGATGTLDYAVTTTTVSGDALAYVYSYYPTGDTSKAQKVSGTSIDVSTLDAGNYTAEVRLLTSTEAGYSAANANYTIDANSKNTQAFVIGSGGAETGKIVWQYSKNGDPATDLFKTDGSQTELTYGLKASGDPDEFTVEFPDISAVSYLTRDTSRTGFDKGIKVVKINDDLTETAIPGGVCTLPGKYKITVALTSDTNHLFDNDTTQGEASVEFSIAKARVDLTKLKLEYGWYDDDKGEVVYNDYDPTNLPVYRDSFVHIRVKGGTNYPAGITNTEIVNESTDYIGDRDLPGTVKVKVKFTLDPNYVYFDGTNEKEGSFNYIVSIDLSKKKIPVSWTLDTVKDSSGNEVNDANGLPYQIYVLDFSANPELAQYVKYEYWYADTSGMDPVADTIVPTTVSGTTTNGQLDHLIDVDGAGKMNGPSTKTIDIIIRPVIDTSVSGYDNFVLDLPGGAVDGADQYTRLGQKKNAVYVTQVATEIVYGTEVSDLTTLYTLMKGTAAYSVNSYTAVIYKGTDSASAVAVSGFDFKTADVGTYTIKFELKASVANSDALSKTSLTLEITQKEIEVPQITGNIVFNSETLSLADFLDGKYKEYLDAGIISAVSGKATARDAGSYTAVIEIINGNYKWKLPAEEKSESKKAVVKYSLADEELSQAITLDGAKKQAEYSWTVAPFKLGTDVIDTSGSDGAKININKLPEWARTMLTEGSLLAGVAYYADEAGTTPLTDEEIVLKGGRSYYVGAVLGGDESKNFTFANDGTVKNTSAAITYKVPQSGAAAFMNTVSEFMTKTLWGLPVWAWFVIGIVALILLIVIIAVACKRRKSKEEREAKKAAKEEEKQRREEERRLQQERLEQERKMQQEKIEAERELARAKQEAELEKIRAQAQMAGAAGMASMAMQQPQQQPMPQMQQQAQQQQMQPVQQQQQMQPQYQPMPMQQPQQQSSGGMDSSVMLALLQSQAAMQAQITEMRASQDASAKAEMEMLKMQMLSGNNSAAYYNAQQMNGRPAQQGISAELLGEAIVNAFTRLAANGAKPAELPAPEPETATANSHAVYPPDAVVTTTTTVDTTQKTPRRTERDSGNDFVDVDGFYDSID